jgi:heme/copper-type cytochrome/quinol oxidase subunit 4
MPCLLALLAVAFPRVAIILLWLFTSFFTGVVYPINTAVVGILGFLFLPLTLIVYTYLEKTSGGNLSTSQLIFVFIAIIVDLGLVGGGFRGRRA